MPSDPATPDAPTPDWLTPDQVCAWIGISRQALDDLRTSGRLSGSYFEAGAIIRYHRDTLRDVLLGGARTVRREQPPPAHVSAPPPAPAPPVQPQSQVAAGPAAHPAAPAASPPRRTGRPTRADLERRLCEILDGAPNVLKDLPTGRGAPEETVRRFRELREYLEEQGTYQEFLEVSKQLQPGYKPPERKAPPPRAYDPDKTGPRKRSLRIR